jgi:hypothetical protein
MIRHGANDINDVSEGHFISAGFGDSAVIFAP